MHETLTNEIRRKEAELERLIRDERHNRRGIQGTHEELVSLRAAAFVSQVEGTPAEDFAKVDRTEQGGIDLRFRCGDAHFALEHTRIESWAGQYGANETARFDRVKAPTWEELPERRATRYLKALEDKLPKLVHWADLIRSESGNCSSILVLEDEDFQYTNTGIVADTLLQLYPGFGGLPDWIVLVESGLQLVVKRHDDQPNRSWLDVLKYGGSIACTPEARGTRPPHTHWAGPYQWDQAKSEWLSQGVPFYPTR